jgi:hypothetical protein
MPVTFCFVVVEDFLFPVVVGSMDVAQVAKLSVVFGLIP